MLYIFDKSENLLEVITEYEEFNYTKKLNSERSLSFEINKNKNIVRYNKVGFFDKNSEFQLFYIDDPVAFKDKKADKVSVSCLADFYNLSNNFIDDKRAKNITEAITKALENSDYKAGIIESFELRDINFYHMSKLKALNEIIKIFKCEFDIRIEIDQETGKIKNKFIDLKHRLGEDTGIRFTYDTALESVEKNVVTEGHFNVLWGFGKSLETDAGGYSRKLDFASINGNKKYVEDLDSINKYGRLEGIYEDSNIEDKTLLLAATKEKLEETKNLKVSYKASIKDISKILGYEHFKVQLGDTIIILDEEENESIEARIISIEENETDTILVLGNFIGALTDDSIEDDLGNLNDKVDNLRPPDITIDPDTIFPDILPDIPILKGKGLFSSIMLDWTFENKNYYTYEIFASKVKDFNPSISDRIFEGKASSYLHQVKPSETWYYRCRAKNSYDKTTDYSLQIEASTRKIADGTEIFENAAIGNATIGELNLDRGWVGELTGHYINAKNLSVTDGNGKKTLDIDSFGNVALDVTSLKIASSNVSTENATNEAISTAINEYKNVVNTEIEEVTNSINSIKNLSDDIFADGVVTIAEKEALKKQKVILEKEHRDVIGQVEALEVTQEIANTAEKTNLTTKKRDLIVAYNKVIAEIDKISLNKIIKNSLVTASDSYTFSTNETIVIDFTSGKPTYGYLYGLDGAISNTIATGNSLNFPKYSIEGTYQDCYVGTYIGSSWVESNRFTITIGENSPEPPPTDILPSSISLNRSSITKKVNETERLTATILPTNATNKNITWSTSNAGVATVINGTITCKNVGNAIITAKTHNNFSVTCRVAVTEDEIIPPDPPSIDGTELEKTIEVYNIELKELRQAIQKCLDKIAQTKVNIIDGKYNKRCLEIEATADGMKTTVTDIQGSMATVSNINTAIANYKKEVDKEFSELTDAHLGLEETMNTSFKDGIISEAEANSINERLVSLEKEKADIDKEYGVIIANSSLTGTAKEELKSASFSLLTSYNALKTAILEGITDSLITNIEINLINEKTETYKVASAIYKEKFTKAIDAIGSTKINSLDNKTDRRMSTIEQTANKIKLEVSKKTNKNELISSINISPESIKISSNKLELNGLVEISDLTDGRTTISGSNIRTGTIRAVDIEGSDIRGTRALYMAPSGTMACDGNTYIRNLYVPETHPAWQGRGSFRVSPTAYFDHDLWATGEVYSKNKGVVNREDGVYIKVDALGVQSGTPNNYLLIKGYQSPHNFGVDLWYSDANLKENINIINTKIRPTSNKKIGLDLINSINHFNFNYKENGGFVDCGYVAQDLQKNNSDLVREVVQNDESIVLEPVTSMLIPNLSLAIKQQQEEINLLKEQIKKLTGGA